MPHLRSQLATSPIQRPPFDPRPHISAREIARCSCSTGERFQATRSDPLANCCRLHQRRPVVFKPAGSAGSCGDIASPWQQDQELPAVNSLQSGVVLRSLQLLSNMGGACLIAFRSFQRAAAEFLQM
jgi:hypothetical protein